MEKRIPHHLKGKAPARDFSPPPRLRIQAPILDTTELIEANSLTLIGRLTNPSIQRLWALYPFFSNRWNLKGKAVGSDLGRGCFQFKFDNEEDLQKVLDNRPYHFDHWMVILQKWEPIISDSFPSSIPFWIDIQGLPKHYWQPAMLNSIGKELGEFMDSEISSSSVKLQILLNGLQPLTKESIIEFPDGTEALISLEYKNLKSHCTHCQRITHDKTTCPGLPSPVEPPKVSSTTKNPPTQASKETSRNYYIPQDNFVAPSGHSLRSERNYQAHKPTRPLRDQPRRAASRLSSYSEAKSRSLNKDNHRRDQAHLSYNSTRSERRNFPSRHQPRRGPEISPTEQNLQWREKTPVFNSLHKETSDSSRTRRPPLERTFEEVAPPTPPPIPTTEEVMGELREVTLQYTNCADPTESAARRRRVLQGESQNLMAETASQMIDAATRANELYNDQRRDPLSTPLAAPQDSLSIPPGFISSSPTPAKKKRGRPPLNKNQSKGPLNLTGAKSSKRNKCTIQSSPKRRNLPGKNGHTGAGTSGSSKRNLSKGPSNIESPRISLVPAVAKKKVDFQNPQNSLP